MPTLGRSARRSPCQASGLLPADSLGNCSQAEGETWSGGNRAAEVLPVCFGDQTEARNLLVGCFQTNKTLAKSRPIAPPQSEDAMDAGADSLQEGVLGPFQVAGSWKESANA